MWAAPGLPGFVPDLHMHNGLPLTYMGLVAGAVTVRDGLLPSTGPWPGISEISAPRSWYDSVAVVVGEGGGWRGFSASLVNVEGIAAPPVGKKPRAGLVIENGSSAVDRNGLMISRGGDVSWGRGAALDEERSGTGQLGAHGQHVWFAEYGRKFGDHTLAGSFSQRGLAGGTHPDARFVDTDPINPIRPPWIGFEEAARGEAGWATWTWNGPSRSLVTRWSRSHDHRESFESETFIVFGEREAQDNAVTVEANAGAGERTHGLRIELHRAQVRRMEGVSLTDLQPVPPLTSVTQQTGWLSARDQRPFAHGTLRVELGGGHVDTPDRKDERWQLAPAVTWRSGPATRRLRLYAERVVTPVFSDLAPGVRPFVQDMLLAGADVALGSHARQWLEVGGLGMEIGNRAGLVRQPVRDIALRFGWTPDDSRVQDAMLTVAGGVRRGVWALEASGFTRVRPTAGDASKSDPATGARARAETGFRAFAGDLGVTLRGEAAWVGERQYVPMPGYPSPPQSLAGYATYSAAALFTLGDATIALRATNLEDVAHPQAWTYPSSPYPDSAPGLGSAMQYRVDVAWPFFN